MAQSPPDGTTDPTVPASLTRRGFLRLSGLAGAGAMAVAAAESLGVSPARAATNGTWHLWSDPATWGGQVPPPGAAVTIDKHILLDMDATVASLNVTARGALGFQPSATRTLQSSGNVVVRG